MFKQKALKGLIAILALTGLYFLTGCGGGGAQYMPAKVVNPRTGILYGYYGRDEAQCVQTAGHVNLVIEMRWDSLSDTIARMKEQPLKTILGVEQDVWASNYTPLPVATAKANLENTFNQLKAAGVLNQVIGFYPIDEPDIWNASDANVTAVNQTIREVAAQYPELKNAVLVVTYANTGRYPGLKSFNWVSVDDYPQGSNVLIGSAMTGLRSQMQPGQRLFLMPGGASPFKNDPTAFVRQAQSDPLVVAVIPFLWKDYEANGKNNQGISSNGLAAEYNAVGDELISQ